MPAPLHLPPITDPVVLGPKNSIADVDLIFQEQGFIHKASDNS